MSKFISTSFTLLSSLLNKNQEVISCAEHSKLKKEYHYEGIQELLKKPLSKKEQKELEAEQKKKIVQTEYEFRQEKDKTLKEHFSIYTNKEKRNMAILQALNDGYGQAEIGRYLNITASAIAKVRNKYE